jgi:hypothetical protein
VPQVHLHREPDASRNIRQHRYARQARTLTAPERRDPDIEKAISQIESEDGWVPLRQLGSQLSNLFSDFDVRSYGDSKLSDLLRKTEAFDIEKGDGGPRIRVRARAASGSPKSKAK